MNGPTIGVDTILSLLLPTIDARLILFPLAGLVLVCWIAWRFGRRRYGQPREE